MRDKTCQEGEYRVLVTVMSTVDRVGTNTEAAPNLEAKARSVRFKPPFGALQHCPHRRCPYQREETLWPIAARAELWLSEVRPESRHTDQVDWFSGTHPFGRGDISPA